MRILWLKGIVCAVLVISPLAVSALPTITTEASFDSGERTITGTVTIPISEYRGVDTMFVRLYPNRFITDERDSAGRINGVVVDSLFVDGANKTAQIWQSDDRVYIGIPMLGRPSESLSLYFHALIPIQPDRFGYSEEQFDLEGWIPVPAPRRNGRWLLVSYNTDIAEPVGDFFDFDVRMELPDTMEFIAPGVYEISVVDSTKTVRQKVSRVIDAPAIISGKYQQDSTWIGDILHRVYYEEPDAWMVESVERWVEQTFEYMSEHVMPYPYPEFVTVVGGFFGGGALEQPQMIWMNKPQAAFLGPEWYRLETMHEAIHQWFYGIIASNQTDNPWMDESITEHFSGRVHDHYLAEDDDVFRRLGWQVTLADVHRIGGAAQYDLYPINLESYRYGWRNYSSVVYMKGSRLLQTIEGLIGPDSVDAFWHEYADRYAFGHPVPSDFYELADRYMHADAGTAERIISNVNRPDFAVTDISSDRNVDDSGRVTFSNSVEYRIRNPLGPPVDLRLTFADGQVFDTTVDAYRGISTLEKEYAAPVTLAEIDPHYRYAVDENFFNNSMSTGRLNGSGLRLFSGVTFMVESLISYLWGW